MNVTAAIPTQPNEAGKGIHLFKPAAARAARRCVEAVRRRRRERASVRRLPSAQPNLDQFSPPLIDISMW
ncbi:MAG: hypothetical protein ACKVWR_06920 [Acidimicrobiales bacterium]